MRCYLIGEEEEGGVRVRTLVQVCQKVCSSPGSVRAHFKVWMTFHDSPNCSLLTYVQAPVLQYS